MSEQSKANLEDHPSSETLLLAIEGELPVEEAAMVAEHLKICWECRMESEEMQNGVFAFMDYRKGLLLPGIGQPPRAWRGFRFHLNQAIEECSRGSNAPLSWAWISLVLSGLRSFLAPVFSSHAQPSWISGVFAVAMALLLIVSSFVHSPVVSAKEFLLRASESRQSLTRGIQNPVIHQRIRIRSGNRSVTRDLYRRPNGPEIRTATMGALSPYAGIESDFQQFFLVHRLDWADPLDAAHFAEWHDSLPTKEDRVIANETDDGHEITLDTSTSSDPSIREASLTVRAPDWHPVVERLRLRDGTEIEIGELLFEVRSEPPSPVPSGPIHAAVPPNRGPANVLDEADLAASEVRARATLHDIGADLGEQIDIRRTASGHIQVGGLVVSEQRKLELVAALRGIPRVQVQLQAVDISRSQESVPAPVASSEESSAPARAVLYEQLQRRFPDSSERREFVNQILAGSQESLMRAWALRRLAERYNASEIKLLNDTSRETLHALLRDHLGHLQLRVAIARAGLMSMLPQSSAMTPATMDGKSSDWQTGVIRVFAAVDRIDHIWTAALVGSETTNKTDAQLADDLLREYTELERYLAQLSQEISNPTAMKEDK